MRPLIRSRGLPLLILAGVMLLTPGVASAQHTGQLTEFIERTAELLDWAADQVGVSESQQARRVLEEAYRLHERSLDLADAGRPMAALSASRRARETSQHAVRLARRSRSQEARLQQRLERLQEYRDQVRERAREAGDERALRFVREAESHGHRALDHYQQGNYDLALHLVESAEDLLARAARLLFEGGGPERLQREIERVRAAIDRIADRLRDRDDTAARGLLDAAEEALVQAEDHAGRGQPLRAMQSLRLARQLAGQAASTEQGGLDAETVRSQIERWDDRYDQVAESVADSGSDPARETLERARRHRDRAAEHLDADALEAALRQIKAAFDLLNEAQDLTR
ncbi:hypothetical protein GF314_04615 [bacterium]|nr:hypothetical protein [bacterium]